MGCPEYSSHIIFQQNANLNFCVKTEEFLGPNPIRKNVSGDYTYVHSSPLESFPMFDKDLGRKDRHDSLLQTIHDTEFLFT